MKVRLDTWAARKYETPPPITTLRKWARAGDIEGAEKRGKYWWVELDPPQELDPLVLKVLNN